MKTTPDGICNPLRNVLCKGGCLTVMLKVLTPRTMKAPNGNSRITSLSWITSLSGMLSVFSWQPVTKSTGRDYQSRPATIKAHPVLLRCVFAPLRETFFCFSLNVASMGTRRRFFSHATAQR